MEEKLFKKYIILWLSQSVSGLGSSMTGFALVLWAYGQSQSAMSVSLMSFCNYVPYVLFSLFVGDFIDRHRKKTIMLVSDSVAAIGSLAVLPFWLQGICQCGISILSIRLSVLRMLSSSRHPLWRRDGWCQRRKSPMSAE